MANLMQSMNTNGATLHYLVYGKGDPLIFIPGSISDYRTWNHIFENFTDKYQCYILSRRFQYPAEYPKNGDSSVAINTKDIADFLKSKNMGPCVLVGHSFGAFIALNIGIEYPELVKSIVAEEPIFAPALAKNPKNPVELIKLMFKNFKAGKSFLRLGLKGIDPTFKALAKSDFTTAKKSFIDGVTGGQKTPETLDELTRVQLTDNIAALSGEDPFINSIQMESLKKITCPVLLLSGTESPFVFHYINTALKSHLPESTLIQIPDAGHWIHIDQKEKYITTVENFLKV